MKAFAKTAHKNDGKIAKEDFTKKFSLLLSKASKGGKCVMSKISSRIFKVFDRNGDGFVDKKEFLAGMTLLIGGSSEEKLKTTFSLFDLDGDGYISLAELTTYLSTFFDVCFSLDPKFHNRFTRDDGKHYSAAEVGESTAINCFEFADKDNDGQINYHEFKLWFASPATFFQSAAKPKLNRDGRMGSRSFKTGHLV
mmetsp:Transcript_840/g.1328  ORF Transcript_840/g.1328 Transcript_840/m.1328 type:complete len:196 (+) Transcript_840:125-712(+)